MCSSDLYNKTVFEWVTSALGAQGTVCGGGRYDGLVCLLYTSKWIYHFGEDNFDNMTNINKKLREKLKAVAEIKAPEVAVEQCSADGTIKWAMQVGEQQVETVYIPEADRATLCVSSQVGCALSLIHIFRSRMSCDW